VGDYLKNNLLLWHYSRWCGEYYLLVLGQVKPVKQDIPEICGPCLRQEPSMSLDFGVPMQELSMSLNLGVAYLV
jgi:hypothetical protein